MRASPLVLAITIGLGLSLPANEAANAASKVTTVQTSSVKTYIVTFEEAPLASFRGSDGKKSGMPKMAATSPSVTGESRLNLNSAATQNYRNYLAKTRKTRLELASQKLGRTLTPTFEYDAAVHGFAAQMTEAEAAIIRTIPGVKRVQKEVIRHTTTDRGPSWIKADQIWAGGGTPAITGNKGTGVIIGVIDTGINYLHPSFAASGTAGATFNETFTITNPKGSLIGLCATQANICNNKLIGIWDYVASGSGTTGKGEDRDGHGTHTASTTSGNAVKISFSGGVTPYNPVMSGVAPRANIIAYKACDDTGCPGSKTLASINRAILDGVNVISYSIGGGPSDPYLGIDGTNDPTPDDDEEAFLAARNAGIVSSVAAGNDGPSAGTVGSPSNAPWVVSVAATTHDRSFINTLKLTGGNTALPGGGTLTGAGNTAGVSTMAVKALVKDPAYPLCGDGTNDDGAATGASKPASWIPQLFDQQMVACQRGFYGRVAKSKNVQLATGSGMVLYNQASDGTSTVADLYLVPTVHLNYTDGVSFTTWLNSGTGHTGQLLGASYGALPSAGDQLAGFSGRGPVIPYGIIKPDIAAPGVDIVAAAKGASCNATSGANCASNSLTKAQLSGTSMATPHVAGAMALLKAVNPSWTPSQIISALQLTARASVTVNGVIGTPHEQGAGQTDVSKAVRAGLFLPVTDAQFKATNATTAKTLNLPSLGNDNCFESCVLSRTFQDMVGGGNYTIVSSLPAGVTMTPSSSTLTFTNGQSQSVNFTFNVTAASNLVGKWVYGSVTLQNTSGNGRPNLTLPVAIKSSAYSNPANAISKITKAVTTERGYFDYSFTGLAGLPNARFIAADLVTPKISTPSIAVDGTGSDPYDVGGTFTDTFVIPASPVSGPVTYRVQVKTSSPSVGQDVDLYVGHDDDNNGLGSEAEQLCASAGGTATEICEFDVVTSSSPSTYWILAQNFAGASPEVVTVQSFQAPIQAGTLGTLVATGPGKLASGTAFKTRIAWDDPSFLAGQTRIGYLLVQATEGSNAIEIPVELTRSGTTFEPYALENNVARSVTLPAGATHNKMYFDVPPNATSVTFTTTGTGTVTLGTVRLASPTIPVIEAAPVGNTFTSNVAGANQTITISGASLQAGRWYVKPTNGGAAAATVSVKAVINTSNAGATFKFGSYYNPARSGHGLFVYGNTTDWAVIWYTYLQDGTPTWYYMEGAKPGANGIWRGTVYHSSWNGTANFLTAIGTAQMTITGTNTFDFHYNLNGETGSESMSAYVTGCPTLNGGNLDISAHWFNPASSGFGYSIQVNPTYEMVASFVYDGIGSPRFLLAERESTTYVNSTETFTLNQVTGFCPLCTRVEPVFNPVGTLTRTYGANTVTSIGTNATYTAGVPGTWSLTSSVAPLTLSQGCTP